MISSRHRTILALGLMATAAVVGFIGWLGVSNETEVAFQLPYLASAGVAALLLLGLGTAILLGVQLERDRVAVVEMETALRELAEEVGRLSAELSPPRGTVHSLGSNGNGRRSPLRALDG